MKFDQKTISETLNETYLKRKSKNSRYSLRAFARDLEISSGALSQILNDKRRISENMAHRFGERLDLSVKDKKRFLESFSIEKAYTKVEYTELGRDENELIRPWYIFGILSLLNLDDFVSDNSYISKRLGISEAEASDGVSMLMDEGLIFVGEQGEFTRTHKRLTTSDGCPSQSLINSHKINFDIAVECLDRCDVNERDFSAITMAIDKKKFPVAVEMIRNFQDRLSCVLEAGDKNEVYKLCVQLFPISR